MKTILLILISSFSLAFFGFQTVNNTKVDTTPSGTQKVEVKTHYDRDNTGVNVRDRDPATVTPFNQNENKADLAITQDIRKALMADKALSTDAKNIKVVTENGNVVLRGPVASADEISAIVAKVKSVKGVKNVDNRLEVIQRK